MQTDAVMHIDLTHTADFKLKAALTLQVVTVRAEQIARLPINSIAGVLSLQQVFKEVPQNTNVSSLAE